MAPNAPTAESKKTGAFPAKPQLNYLPAGVYLDDLCYAVIMNDLNYRNMSLTATEPCHQDTQRDLKPPD